MGDNRHKEKRAILMIRRTRERLEELGKDKRGQQMTDKNRDGKDED